MTTEPAFGNRWWTVSNTILTAWNGLGMRSALTACLVAAGLGLTATAQSFYNLDFEQATLIPVSGDPYGRVDFGAALPGWIGYCGTQAQGLANYDSEFLDSAGISIFDSKDTDEPVAGVMHGRYCACLYSGVVLGTYNDYVGTWIAQTGWIPTGASNILFNFSPSRNWGQAYVSVTFNGIPIPLSVVSGGGTGPSVLSGDLSRFAGQVGELRFTAPIPSGPGYPQRKIFLMDYIRFPGTTPPPDAPTIVAFPQNQSTEVGTTVDLVVSAAGRPPLAYQWFFDGTNAITSGTSRDLRLVNVQPSQAGFYSVVITNAFGAVTSSPAMLTVTGSPPVIVTPPSTQAASIGQTVDLTVSAAGSPPLSYQWLFNASPISGAGNTHLQLTNVQLSQSGAYSVVVTNAFGAVTSGPTMLSVSPSTAYEVLHSFIGSDGWRPEGDLLLVGTTLYGTTAWGSIGYAPPGSYGYGTVFKVETDGSDYAVLRAFARNNTDGGDPAAGLVLSGTTLYGTTGGGGASDFGTIFKVNTDGSGYGVLKFFDSIPDGDYPCTRLVLAGTTLYGTTHASTYSGVVFKLNTDGSGYTILKSYNSYDGDGAYPDGSLALSGSILYGTTSQGGSDSAGTVFKVNIDGSGFAVLKAFTGLSDGAEPRAGLVLSDGTLYGTTAYGGSSGQGTVFKAKTDGSGFTLLKQFSGADGAYPWAGLLLSGTTLYGTTSGGGTFTNGTVFKLDIDGTGYTVLKHFAGGSDGANPYAGLALAGSTLYGTTGNGGVYDRGVVFSLGLLLPTMLTTPANQTAEAGSAATFRVRATGTPAPTYEWFFNGTNALGSATTNCALLLTNVQPTQAGAYTVVVTNAFGAVTSAPALLSVIPPVERRWVPSIGLTGQVGMLVNLEYADAVNPGPNWRPFATVPLTSASQFYFDLSVPRPPQRFFRAWQTGAPGALPALDLHMVPAITLTGGIGKSVRLDYINRFGPTDAWGTLATVILTNTSQLYFDTATIGQPPRLYRVVLEP